MNQATVPQYAGFWRRVLATLIDTVIYAVLLTLLLGPAISDAALFSFDGFVRMGIALALTIVLWMKFLGTPGKLLLGCQVVDADNFTPMSLRQSVLRYVAYLASMLPLMLGFLWVAKDSRKQGFHDKIANTVVLYDAAIEVADESQKSLMQHLNEIR